MELGIEPLGHRMLVKRVKPPSETEGGLALSDLSSEAAKAGIQRGVVIALGEGRKSKDGTLVPFQCSVGDIVVFGRWGGIEVGIFDHDGQEVLVMPETEVLAIEQEVSDGA